LVADGNVSARGQVTSTASHRQIARIRRIGPKGYVTGKGVRIVNLSRATVVDASSRGHNIITSGYPVGPIPWVEPIMIYSAGPNRHTLIRAVRGQRNDRPGAERQGGYGQQNRILATCSWRL